MDQAGPGGTATLSTNSRRFDEVPLPRQGFQISRYLHIRSAALAYGQSDERRRADPTLPEGAKSAYFLHMPTWRRTILLTGFGPFPGVPENATAQLVPELARAACRRWPGYHVEPAVLPTEWRTAPESVAALIGELKPAIALHFGVSSRARGFAIETRGENRARPICDAAGLLPPSERLSPDGPDVLAASLPSRWIAEHLRRRSLPVSLSRDAGGYLCNAVLYHSLQRARGAAWRMRSGFVHLPATLDRRGTMNCRLSWDEALHGSLEILAATLGRPSAADPSRSEGRAVQRLAPRRRAAQAGGGKPAPVG